MPLHTNFHVNLFADDTVLIMKNKNINQLQQQVIQELGIIDEWTKCSRLSLNYAKTSYIVYTPKCSLYLLYPKIFVLNQGIMISRLWTP